MKDVKPILVSLGLQESEVATYLAALAKGSSSAAELSHAAGYSRQSVYLAIESLRKRGLMTFSESGKKILYSAEHPDRLLAFARRREAEMRTQVEDLERIVPQLELSAGGEKPIVKVYDGKDGLLTILALLQEIEGGEVYEFTDVPAMMDVLRVSDLEPLRRSLQERRIRVHGIYLGSPSAAQKTTLATAHYLPVGDASIGANIGVYGNKIVLVSFAGKMQSMTIESKPLVAAFTYLLKLAAQAAQTLEKRT